MGHCDTCSWVLVVCFLFRSVHSANASSLQKPFISNFVASTKTPSLVVLSWKYDLGETIGNLSKVTYTKENRALLLTRPIAFRVLPDGRHIAEPCTTDSPEPERLESYFLLYGQTLLNDDLPGASDKCGMPKSVLEDVQCSIDNGTCTYYFDKLRCGTLYKFQLNLTHHESPSNEYIAETSQWTFPCIDGILVTNISGVYSTLFQYNHYFINDSFQAPQDIVLRYSRNSTHVNPGKQRWSTIQKSETFCSLYDYPGPSYQFSILNTSQNINEGRSVLGDYSVYSVRLSKLAPHARYFYQIYAPYGDAYIYAPHGSKFFTIAGPPDPPRSLNVDVASPQNIPISWQEPERDGGASVHYMVEYRNKSSVPWVRNNVTVPRFVVNDGVCPNCQLSVRVAAANKIGQSDFVNVTRHRKKPASKAKVLEITAGTVSFGVVISFLTVLVILVYRRHHRKKLANIIAEFECERHQIILPRELECLPKVSKENIIVSRELGEGNFGKVFDGFVSNLDGPDSKSVRAAFKSLRINASMADRNELLEEALTMRNLDHPNIIKLLGLCVDGTELWLILEMMDAGDLLSLLRESRPSETMPSHVSLDNLLRIGCDIARGCEYISSMGYIHRDLATRNCLVDSRDPDVCTVKIADFGLTRGVYKKCYYRLTENSILPIRWTAPEVLREFNFSARADVWSFGIVLWEIMTLGKHPYQEFTNIEVIELIKGAKYLPKPDRCPLNIFHIMTSCWTQEPDNRPAFAQVLDTLHQIRHIQPVDSINKPYMLSFKRQREVDDVIATGGEVVQIPPILSDLHSEVPSPVLESVCIYQNCSGQLVSRAKRVKGATIAESFELRHSPEHRAKNKYNPPQHTGMPTAKPYECHHQLTNSDLRNNVLQTDSTVSPVPVVSEDTVIHLDASDHLGPNSPSSDSGYSNTSDLLPPNSEGTSTTNGQMKYLVVYESDVNII